jgi:hydrophobe/amphiphile efflux-3 (HAE3) family protein
MGGSVDALIAFATRRAGLLLVLVAVLTLGAVTQIVDPLSGDLRLIVDPSIDSMLPEDDAGRRYYDHVRQLFGSDETVLVALVSDDIFTASNLERIERMTRRIEALSGVHHVVSLATAVNLRAEGDELEVAPFLETLPSDAAARGQLRREVLENPVYAGSLVSADGSATVLSIHLRDMSERKLVASGLIQAIERVVHQERGEASVWVTGGLYAKAENARLMLEDIRRTLPLAVAVAMLVAWLSFRSVRGVLIPAATTLISVAWTLGFIAAIGTPLNLLTVIIPTLLFVVGFAYAIHVVSEYYEVLMEREPGDESRREVVSVALRRVALPVSLTGVTTAAGFLALTTSPIHAIKQFGLFSTLGVAITVGVSLTFAPAVLALLPEPTRVRDRVTGGRFDRAAEWLARFDVQRRVPILAAGAAVALVAAAGMLNIRVSTDFVEPGSPLHRSAIALNEHLEGANAFYVVLETDYADAFKEPPNLREIQSLQRWLEEQSEVGGTTSLVDYLMLINRGFHGGAPEDLVIPDSKALISQLFFFGANDELERFVDSRYRTTSIHVRSTVNDSASMQQLVNRIEARTADLPEKLSATVTGNTVLVTHAIDDIVRGQAVSLAFAFAMILAVLSLLFTSVRVGMLALIPNALPVLLYFGILGLSGITLNSTTGLVACLVLGIAVDDSIHFLARFNDAAKRLADETRGISEALRSVGRPVTYTSIALCLGFLVLTLSHFHNQVQFGALAAVTLAFAWLVDITFTPALASRMHIVTLWDALTLDLGEDPQRSIPLFNGLRKTQARITALMASIVEFPKGHRIFSAGDAGADMYVVIEGKLLASLATDAGTVRFRTHERGDVVGEVGLIHGSRTADVTAESDVRLLRLTRESLDRIRRRYPRTAAKLYANLSEILADRVATTTERLR